MNNKVKIRVEMLKNIAEYSDREIADIVRSIIFFYEDGVVPNENDPLIKEKNKFISAIKRSVNAIERLENKKSQDEIKAMSDKKAEEFKQLFSEWYTATFDLPYHYTKSDNTAVTGLLNNVAEQMRKGGIPTDDNSVIANTMLFVKKVYDISDEWLKERFRIGLLNSMYSTLYYRIKTKQNGKQNSNISADYVASTIADYVGAIEQDNS